MNSSDQVARLWSDDELDALLAELGALRPVDSGTLERVRGRLLSAASSKDEDGRHHHDQPMAVMSGAEDAGWLPTRRRHSAIGVILLAAALVAAVLIGPAFLNSVDTTNRPAAGAIDELAAATLRSADPTVPASQYRYIRTHAWWASMEGDGLRRVWLDENVLTTWVPSDPGDPGEEWLLRRATTGAVQWIRGGPDEPGSAVTLPSETFPTSEVRGYCGDFSGSTGCTRDGTFADPTPAFLAALPRDPDALVDLLRQSAPSGAPSDVGVIALASMTLATGWVPADLRAALYEALHRLPDLEVINRTSNVDGAVGIALGVDNPESGTRQDILIDAETGAFIGERTVVTSSVLGLPIGTVLSTTAVTTAVVGGIGAEPA